MLDTKDTKHYKWIDIAEQRRSCNLPSLLIHRREEIEKSQKGNTELGVLNGH